MPAHCKKQYYEYKDRVYAALGQICKRCGFPDRRALQIDHVEGGGWRSHGGRVNKLGTRVNKGYGYLYLKSILEDPELYTKYQILCANCNWIKRHENREVAGARAHESVPA